MYSFIIMSKIDKEERWVACTGLLGDMGYICSDRGRVARVLKGGDSHGYRAISVRYMGKVVSILVHRLIAKAFLGACPDGYVVNHKDENKINNAIDNLEYVTPKENFWHSFRRHPDRYKQAAFTRECKRDCPEYFIGENEI